MSRSAARARTGHDRTSLYSEITDKIIAELEAGRVPWVQPWGTSVAKAPIAMPKNAATQRRYSGINVLILWGAVIGRGFAGQSWLTFRQASSLGGNVRKGEHGTTVVYADRFIPDEERKRAERDGDEPGAIPFLKRFTVFNTDQCENLPGELVTAPPPVARGSDPPPGQGADRRDRRQFSHRRRPGLLQPRARITCRCPGLTPISSRSTGTGRHSMSSVTGSAIPHAWLATCRACSDRLSMPRKSWSPK